MVSSFFFLFFRRYEFLRTPATQLTDGGRDLLMKQLGFQLINPTEKWFPGISELRENFSSWDWRIGKTPKFSVQKSIQLKSESGAEQSQQQPQQEMKVKVDVEKVSWGWVTWNHITIELEWKYNFTGSFLCCYLLENPWFKISYRFKLGKKLQEFFFRGVF